VACSRLSGHIQPSKRVYFTLQTWTLLSCDEKNVEGIPHEVPTPNPAHTLVSACHKP